MQNKFAIPTTIYIDLHCGVCVCVCVLATQSCLTSCNPMDYSPPGSSIHGILQARILEWAAIAHNLVSAITLPN